MGSNSSDSVVNEHLQLHHVNNVNVVSTSVLPTGGGANPTMMLLLLAIRCVDHAVKSLK
jgi:choline dehydrogenase-like flavoprotein